MKNLFSLAVLLLLTFLASKISAQPTINGYTADLLSVNWDLTPNWENQGISGKTKYHFKMLEKANFVTLDAEGPYKFSAVKVNGAKAKWEYTGSELRIYLPYLFKKGAKVNVSFNYETVPTTSATNPIGEDKGLFYVNPTGKIPGWPTHCYTQGETQSFRKIVPTRDELVFRDKFTGRILLTVPDSFVTLANGLRIKSTTKNGYRTDTWKVEKPQPGYLWFFGAGQYAIIEDSHGELPIYYYVEPQYRKDAFNIYGNTPRQIAFFEKLLGLDYQWEKYGLITVRRYGAGAMENTSATLFGEHVMTGTTREIANAEYNYLVTAHELWHQWFGDLTTASDWGSLTINEGQATLSEYLYAESLDSNTAKVFRKNDRQQYFAQSYGLRKGYGNHALIDSTLGAINGDTMFDRVSYDKGGLVLWMLKSQLGDSVFFAGERYFLQDNAMGFAGWRELKAAFEKVSGKDLTVFFEQWYLGLGHPIISFNYLYVDGKLLIQTEQLQKSKGWGFFDVRVPVSVYTNAGKQTVWLDLNSRSVIQKFEFSVSEPTVVIPDEERNLLVDWRLNYSLEDFSKILFASDKFMPRYEAADSLIKYKSFFPGFRWNAVCLQMAKMDDWRFRFRAVQNCDLNMSNVGQDLVSNGIYDSNYYVRMTAANRTSGFLANNKLTNLFTQDSSLEVQSAALLQIAKTDSLLALQLASARWELRPSDFMHERYLTYALSSQFAKTGDTKWTPYFKEVCQRGNFYCRYEVQESLKVWLSRMPEGERKELLMYLSLFDGEFDGVIEAFVPKTLPEGTGK